MTGEEQVPGTSEALLSVRNLSISSSGNRGPRKIVLGADLVIHRGETVGIVGESGSGKSMTARAIVRLLPEGVNSAGQVLFDGRDLQAFSRTDMTRLRGRRIALLFQDPFTMLNPLRKCGTHISEGLAEDHGRAARRKEAIRRLAEVGIVDAHVAEKYPFQLSGGMRQRVALAAALAHDPDLLIADEPTTALDVTTQAAILELIDRLRRSRGMSVLLITHDLRVAFSACDRVYVMYAGAVLEVAAAADIEREPLHPYSLGLLMSEPPVTGRLQRLASIEGQVADPSRVEAVCVFSPRCKWSAASCVAQRPALEEAGPGRLTACLRIHEIRSELNAVRTSAGDLVYSENEDGSPSRRPVVEIRDLYKVFQGREGHEVHALRGVSLEIGINESVGLVGESGSGKTTLGRCLVGLDTPTEGVIRIDNTDVSNYRLLSRVERASVRKLVQIVFQDPYSCLDPRQTVGAAFARGASLYRLPSGSNR